MIDSPALTPTRANPSQATSAVAFAAPPPEDDDPLLAFEPYLHPHPRKRSITPEVQRAFVAQLAATGIVKQAARHVGRSLEALYKLRHKPGAEGFSAAWDAALERGVQRLEDCALERAIRGTRTPIVSGGKLLGWHDKPDNNMLRFLLRHRLPQKYGAQAEEIGPGHPVWEELAAQAREEVAEIHRELKGEVFARAIALQVWRRRKLYRARQEAGENAVHLGDAWDAADGDGLPQLPRWGYPANRHHAQAEAFLDELEREGDRK